MRIAALVVTALVIGADPAQAEMAWRSTPEIARTEETGHRHGGPSSFFLRDGAGSEVVVWTPDLHQQTLPFDEKGVRLKPTGLDGYHLWLARRVGDEREETALRYLYVPGKPTGKSPADLLAIAQARLQIVPDPLPREHWRYESGETAAFVVRFDGRPLGHTSVRMATSNGSLFESSTDAEGRVRFVLPDDFAAIRAGRQRNLPAEFISSVEFGVGGRRFHTTLSGSYHVNPRHWQSSTAGLMALAAGFAAGLIVLRRAPEAKV